MHHGVGIAKAATERRIERDVGDFLATHRIHQPQFVDENGHGAGGIADAQRVEAVEGVGPELDAGADFAQHRRLLQHQHRQAALRQSECGGQAADAAAGDDEGQ